MSQLSTKDLITQHIAAIALLIGLAMPCLAMGQNPISAEPYPHLNSNADGTPARCPLKPEEAEWLEARMEEGKIRLATPEDIKAWEDLAKSKGRPNHTTKHIDCGRMFVITKPLTISKNVLPNYYIAFIVQADVPFPTVENLTPVLDMKTGGWFQGGRCDDGTKDGIGKSARDCK